jgi:AraC-like DNA-binding protein
MHGAPARNWTIEELAKDVRMQIASGLLSGGSANIATVAAEIDYGSEAAFSRAFKKMVGVRPRPGVALRHDGSWPSSVSLPAATFSSDHR